MQDIYQEHGGFFQWQSFVFPQTSP